MPQRRSWRERLSSVLKGSGRAHPNSAVALGVCTFGSPRVGNHRFGSLLTQAVESGEAPAVHAGGEGTEQSRPRH